jgi:proline racemase/DNA-binding transcriptional MerR regulator/quercetin dioxygenase-like cupin family protein
LSDQTNNRKPYSIGHAAKVTGVSVSTLRSWESFGLIEPFKSPSGHRSFSSEDLDRIRQVEQLRRLSGMNLASIRRALDGVPVTDEAPLMAPEPERRKVEFEKIGETVRNLRQEAGMSLRELSDRTEIGVSHLSMFERGAAFLSPARMSAIAEVFHRTLAEILGGTSRRDMPIVRKGEGRIVSTFGPGVAIEQLTVAERLMDAEVWTIEAGRESDGFYAHDGEELIYLLEGELEITLSGREAAILRPGDSAYFNSRIGHRWRNISGQNAVVLWINTDVERLGSMHFEKRGRRLDLGVSRGTGLGEGGLNVELPGNSETYRVLETHTAGHPTRILIEPLSGLEGETVAEKARAFERRYDHLRSMLLQEPRGHVGSFGLVPVPSDKADFGAFFITSYGYPRFCGHAVLGYAKALEALGRLKERQLFSVEMPGGIVEVDPGSKGDLIQVCLPAVYVTHRDLKVRVEGRTLAVQVSCGSNIHALVEAADLGFEVTPDNLGRMLAAGEQIRQALGAAEPALAASLDSVLFCQSVAAGRERLFLAIDRQRYDRSPGVGGVAARMSLLMAQGRLKEGEVMEAESIFGGHLQGRITGIAEGPEGRPAYIPKISGRAHLNGISTLILEPDDPLRRGFLG